MMNVSNIKYKFIYAPLSGGGEIQEYWNIPTDVKDLIFVGGRGGSGKSTVAKKYSYLGYEYIPLDELIREEIIPHFVTHKKISPAEKNSLFCLYSLKNKEPVIEEARKMFTSMVKTRVDNRTGKMVLEGSLKDNKMIRYLFGTDFTFIYVMPGNPSSYMKKIMSRFAESPDNYGRLGYLALADKDGEALRDYKKKGMNGTKVMELFQAVSKSQLKKANDIYESFLRDFDVIKHINM